MESGAGDIASTYRKLDHRAHVLLRPGMYVGSVEPDTCNTWVYDATADKMVFRQIQYIPALYKIFDEILMNAIDHSVRLKRNASSSSVNPVKNIKVEIDRTSGTIKVWNDGDGIDVVLHPEHNCYVPELIFGHLLTSANYDDDDAERIIGGQNGIGAKACNIFSSSFIVETVDAGRKKIYTQRFCNNMQTADKPIVKACAKKPYTCITFTPDYARFGNGSLSDDMYALMVKRVHDATAVTDADVSVHLNSKKLECKTFERYVDMYVGGRADTPRVYEKLNDAWEIVVTCAPESGVQHVSFVNGVWTMRGGKHLDYVIGMITRKLGELIQDRKKDAVIKPQYLRDNLFVFLKSTIPNPSFDSQSKETLTTPASKFGCRIELNDKFIEKLYKLDLVERALALSQATSAKALKKTDGKKQSTITGIPKLDDANWAGTAKSQLCTLILTEGDSAKTMAISGLDQVGRDRFGVYPLRGKVMNVCDASAQKIADNKEISDIKKILGLETEKVYTSTAELRYGRVMALCDSDADGSHIKGLVMYLFQRMWPSLLKIEGFMTSMLTPIIKTRKRTARGEQVLEFFNMPEFEAWLENNDAGRGWDVKYYKGLGTSTSKEAKEYFRKMRMVVYRHSGPACDDMLDLAFNKKRPDDRKTWLMQYDKTQILDYGNSDVTLENFVNKDLSHFSNYDLVRSIPNVMDGLKVSHRKVLYAVFKKNIVKNEIRVASLSGIVQTESAYHHGDAALNGTIVSLAQDYVGANNINLLMPNGQFGSRVQGGMDCASARYIHTVLNPVALKIFIKDDESVLVYNQDDGQRIEPEHYMPIIPMILVNGTIGIGTGFSTNVPCFNPIEIIDAVAEGIDALEASGAAGSVELVPRLRPWYRGFTGVIEDAAQKGKYVSRGTYQRTAPTKVRITELPIGTWTENFKELLDQLLQSSPDIKKIDSNYGDETVDFTVHFTSEDVLNDWLLASDGAIGEDCRLVKDLKLVSNKYLNINNMYLFDANGRIKKYDTPEDIIADFLPVRLAAYAKRKLNVLDAMRGTIAVLSGKARFLQEVIDGDIVVSAVSKSDLESMLLAREYDMVDGSYDHLTRMPIYALTLDKKREVDEELARTQRAFDAYEKLAVFDIWRADLDALRQALM